MPSPCQPLSKLFSGLPPPFAREQDKPSLYCQLVPHVINSDDIGGPPSHFPPFLPLNTINSVVTTGIPRPRHSCFPSIFKPAPSHHSVERAKKSFAILGLCEKQAVIWDLLNEGLTDEDLPLSKFEGRGLPITSNILVSRKGKKFESFSKLENIAVENFLEKQWLALAPIFSTPGQHISLDRKNPLPFLDIKYIPTRSRSTVYKGMLHAAHVMPQVENHVQIAIKCYTNAQEFKRENENLEKIQNLKHKHLIRHIATVRQGDLFYAILPWASGGSLSDFWGKYPDALRTRETVLFLWCFQQMLGLIDALVVLHEINCRHGDLKPDNILRFEASDDSPAQHNQYGTLVITDVGVSRVHYETTGHRFDPTTTKATTQYYEAPEVETNMEKPRSRRYDMWSVGCVFMEFIIWLLYGERAIGNFRESRRRDDNSIPHNGAYYKRTGKGVTAEVHPVVSRGFDALTKDPRCVKDTGLRDLVDLIANDLIVIDPQRRLEAKELREKFNDIVIRAEENPEYLLRMTEPPPSVPNVFLLGGQGDSYG
ncbi:kinase-like protein [Nemania abortiva]|nr:kinase-like protein [Nemania abortiva]